MFEVCVWSFGPGALKQKLNVQHYQDKILVKDLLTAVSQSLGVDDDNVQFFAIFEGSLLNPLRKLDENYELHLPSEKSLSIQKWSFDLQKEKRALKSDMAALKLFRCQVLFDIQAERLQPSEHEIETLEDSFVAEQQAMKIIYSLKDYGTTVINNCQVISELALPQLSLAKREYVTLLIDRNGITVRTNRKLAFQILFYKNTGCPRVLFCIKTTETNQHFNTNIYS